MELLNEIISKIIISYFVIAIFYYAVPSSIVYYLFYIRNPKSGKDIRIQQKHFQKDKIYTEVKWSLISIGVFAVLTGILLIFVEKGHTKVYHNLSAFGVGYLIVSVLLAILLHDTFFYWIHRLMNWKPLFKSVHARHHLSKTPTPWACFSFSPLEALIQFPIYPIMLFLLPLHPIAIAFFLFNNILHNTLGHAGHEFLPTAYGKHKVLRYFLTPTHHDLHHSNCKYNFGIYFSFWDRLMGTNHEKYESIFLALKSRENTQKQ